MKNIYSIALACVFTAISTFSFAQDDVKSAMKKNKEKFKNTNMKCDVKFAARAAEANLIDVEFGQLAQTKGTTQQVKDLGKSFVDGHSSANAELKTLADKKGIVLPTQICKSVQKYYDRLAKKEGKDFDKAFIKCAVKGHKRQIKCGYLKEAEKGKDNEIAQWAAEKLPTLYQHLRMGKDACRASK